MREMKAMYDCIELYNLEEATVLELVSYCIEQKGKRVSTNYILAVAQTWNESGIITPAQAKEYLEKYRASRSGATEILLRWNRRRRPTKDEMDLYDKWIGEWGFDQEAILAVCPQLVEVGSPTFAILNDRLERMRDQNRTTAEKILEKTAHDLDDREFTKLVFKHLGKEESPTRTDIAQIGMFRNEKEIDPEAILLGADKAREAERPFGALKKILIDWAARGVRSLDAAQKNLAETDFGAMRKKKMRKRNYGSENYEQRPVKMEELDNLIVDLNEDL